MWDAENAWWVSYVHWLLVWLHVLLGLAASWHALLSKRDPRAAMGWIAVCLLSPLAGPLLYYFFGINRVARRARDLRAEGLPSRTATGGSEILPAPPQYPELPPQYRRLAGISAVLGCRALRGGNRFELLQSGDAAYPQMLAAIETARSSICLETYIFMTDEVGLAFIDALERAVHRGVEVRVLIDGAGDYYSLPRSSRLLRERGIAFARFLPPRLLPPSLLINLRNHRKILAVDGEAAFVGGMNINGRFMGVEDAKAATDMHFKVTGPVVGQIVEAFAEDWQFAAGEALPRSLYALAQAVDGSSFARLITDGPEAEVGVLSTLIATAISAAEQRVAIMTPYFLPSLELASAIESAALRGVDVTLLLPGVNNLPYVHWASRHILGELIKRGVAIYYQPSPFVHSKLLLIDEYYVQIGSANLDSRSLRLNFELAVEVFDANFARQMAEHFHAAKARSRLLALDELLQRSLIARTRDAAGWLLSPYL